MEAKDWIPITISALSLLLSAYTLYMQHRQNKERLKVKLSTGFTASPGHVSETMLLAEAANIGGRPVTISSYSLQIPDNRASCKTPNRQVLHRGISLAEAVF